MAKKNTTKLTAASNTSVTNLFSLVRTDVSVTTSNILNVALQARMKIVEEEKKKIRDQISDTLTDLLDLLKAESYINEEMLEHIDSIEKFRSDTLGRHHKNFFSINFKGRYSGGFSVIRTNNSFNWYYGDNLFQVWKKNPEQELNNLNMWTNNMYRKETEKLSISFVFCEHEAIDLYHKPSDALKNTFNRLKDLIQDLLPLTQINKEEEAQKLEVELTKQMMQGDFGMVIDSVVKAIGVKV